MWCSGFTIASATSAPVEPRGQVCRVRHLHLLDDAHVWYHRLPGDGRLPTWEHFVLLIAAPLGPQITHGGGSGAGDIQGGGNDNLSQAAVAAH
jgi:hypothetical protein